MLRVSGLPSLDTTNHQVSKNFIINSVLLDQLRTEGSLLPLIIAAFPMDKTLSNCVTILPLPENPYPNNCSSII